MEEQIRGRIRVEFRIESRGTPRAIVIERQSLCVIVSRAFCIVGIGANPSKHPERKDVTRCVGHWAEWAERNESFECIIRIPGDTGNAACHPGIDKVVVL